LFHSSSRNSAGFMRGKRGAMRRGLKAEVDVLDFLSLKNNKLLRILNNGQEKIIFRNYSHPFILYTVMNSVVSLLVSRCESRHTYSLKWFFLNSSTFNQTLIKI